MVVYFTCNTETLLDILDGVLKTTVGCLKLYASKNTAYSSKQTSDEFLVSLTIPPYEKGVLPINENSFNLKVPDGMPLNWITNIIHLSII